MIAVGSLILVLLLSLIVVRIAAEALILTGMSREAARFQARSAWTGTGFTTAEAEQVVSHPVRRQIVSTLMFLRSAGLVTAASTLMLSFVSVEERREAPVRLLARSQGRQPCGSSPEAAGSADGCPEPSRACSSATPTSTPATMPDCSTWPASTRSWS